MMRRLTWSWVSNQPRAGTPGTWQHLRAGAIAATLVLMTPGPSGGWDIPWITQFGTPGVDESFSAAADPSGVYVCGYTSLALPGQSSAGSFDVFLRKYDPSGGLQWTVQFGTSDVDFCFDVAADGSGVYVAGLTNGTLPGQVRGGFYDVFVRKYSPDGQEVWTTQFGTTDFDAGSALAANAGAAYVAGETHGAFEGQVNEGDRDAFVTKIGFA